MKMKIFVVSLVLSAICGANVWAEEELDTKQQFLFFMEEGYLQEQGEWEANLSSLYQDGLSEGGVDSKEWKTIAGFEFGLTEWLQVETEFPWLWKEEKEAGTTERESGLGDIEVGLRAIVLEENEDGLQPTVSVGIEMSLPSGDWKEGLGAGTVGYGPVLGISKTVGEWVFHAGGGLEWFNDAKEREGTETEKADIFEMNGGAAVVYQGVEDLEMILEVFGEYEAEEPEDGHNKYETELYLSPGLRYEVARGIELGGGVPIGLNDDSYDVGLFLKLLCEW